MKAFGGGKKSETIGRAQKMDNGEYCFAMFLEFLPFGYEFNIKME